MSDDFDRYHQMSCKSSYFSNVQAYKAYVEVITEAECQRRAMMVCPAASHCELDCRH